MSMHALLTRLSVLAALSLPAAADVLVVAAAGGGDHTQIAAAVAAASPGDVLLVKSGAYTGFVVDAKSLSVVGETGASITVGGSIGVRNLAPDQTVVLANLASLHPVVSSSSTDPIVGAGFFVTGCAGAVRVQDCRFQGAAGSVTNCWDFGHPGRTGAYVASSTSVAFERCTLIGGAGSGHPNFGQCWCGAGGRRGGDGLVLSNSLLACYDGSTLGGKGGRGAEVGGDGAHGAHLSAGLGMLASNSSFQGGIGGIADADVTDPSHLCVIGEGGDGGHGLSIQPFGIPLAATQLVGGSYAGGLGGIPFNGPTGATGEPIAGPNVFALAGPPRVMVALALARESTSVTLTFHGVPGDDVSVRVSTRTGFLNVIAWKGVLLTDNPRPELSALIGTIPASGTLTHSFDLADLGRGVASRTYFVQAQFRTSTGASWLGSFAALTVLDSAY